jgi:hypothetical protein
MFSGASEACASDIGRVSRGWRMAKKRVIGEEAYSPGGGASWEYRTEKLGGQCRDRVGSGESAGSVVGKNLPGGRVMWQDAEHEIALAEYGPPREQQRRRRGWTGWMGDGETRVVDCHNMYTALGGVFLLYFSVELNTKCRLKKKKKKKIATTSTNKMASANPEPRHRRQKSGRWIGTTQELAGQ